MLLGAILTGLLTWRCLFFINIPLSLAALAGSGVLIEEQRNAGRLDTPGAIGGTGAAVALTYGSGQIQLELERRKSRSSAEDAPGPGEPAVLIAPL